MTTDVGIEIGFGYTWQTASASIDWVDVTGYVLEGDGMTMSSGASSARGKVDAGQLSFSLLNSDRRFDPTHAAGPYYGELLPGVPVRIVIPTGGTLVEWDDDLLEWDGDDLAWGSDNPVIWRGTVASWPQRYDIGNTMAYVPIRAYDGFDKLARASVARSVLETVVLSTNPRSYWPMRETSGRSMNDLGVIARTATFNTSMPSRATTMGVPSGHTFPAMVADGGDSASITTSQAVVVGSGYRHTFAALIDISSVQGLADGDQLLILERGSGSDNTSWDTVVPSSWWGVEIVSEAAQTARMFWAGTFVWEANRGYSSEFSYSTARFVACRADKTAGDVNHYIDGVLANGTSDPATITAYYPSGIRFFRKKTNDDGVQGDISNIIWNSTTVGTAAVVADWAAAALSPLTAQTSDQRLTYLLDDIGWPADLRDLDEGASILGPATFEPGDNVLSYMQQVEATEYGRMFIARNGSITFRNRYAPFMDAASTTSQFTFSDATPSSKGYAEFELDLDDELLVNVAKVTRRGGTEQVATNATSVATYGEAETQLTGLLHTSDNEAKSQADWIVASSADPLPRIPRIRTPLHRYETIDRLDALALEIGQRVTVVRTPQGVGSAISLEFLISGIEMQLNGSEWWQDLYVEPVPQDTLSLFLLDDSLLDSVTDVLAY